MLKIFQVKLQYYVNQELPEVQGGFRKDRETREQIANIRWIIEKARDLQKNISVQFSCSVISDCAIPWTAACQTSLSITNSWSLFKLMSIKLMSHPTISSSVIPFQPSTFPSIRVFSNESVLHIRWPKYWSFIFSISPSNEYSWLISFKIHWFLWWRRNRMGRPLSPPRNSSKDHLNTETIPQNNFWTLAEDTRHQKGSPLSSKGGRTKYKKRDKRVRDGDLSGEGVLKEEKFPNTRRPSHRRVCGEFWNLRGQHNWEEKINK